MAQSKKSAAPDDELAALRERVAGLEKLLSESTKAQEISRGQQQELRTLLENAGPAYVRFQQHMDYPNRAFEEMTGYSKEELSLRTFAELVHPSDRDDFETLWKHRSQEPASDTATRREWRLLKKGGEECWVDLWLQVITRDGEPLGLATAYEITPRKLTEARLRESDERFRSIADNSIAGIYILQDGKFVYVNKAFQDTIGFSGAEILSWEPGTFTRLIHADDRQFVREQAQLKQSGREDATAQYDMRYVNKNGDVRWLNLSSRRIPVEGGNAILGILLDVTQRKKTEQELKRLAAFPNENPSPVFEADGVGNIQYVNPAAERVMKDAGFSDPTEFIPPQHREFIQDCLSYGQGIRDVRVNYGASIYSWSYHPIKEMDAVHLYAVDVTDAEIADRERLHLEKQVQHAQKLESLGVLAGGIAHDFNNLLTGILGNASLVRRRLDEESPVQKNVIEIEKIAQRAAELTKQMLAYSGKGKFVVQSLNLSYAVEELGHLLHSSISKKANLVFDFAESLPSIEADATQIEQIIMNLITNASEALEEQTGTITIRTGTLDADRAYLDSTFLKNELPEGRYTFFEVSDSGCGMDQATVSKIFDPFFTTKVAGRGLGLAAVLGIVHDHSGALKIYSEPEFGTTVRILFPCSEQAPISSKPAIGTLSKGGEYWHGTGTILVVDDEETVRELAQDILEEAGFTVLLAVNGLEGVAAYGQYHTEIVGVLLDLTMPVMSGEEAYAEILKIDPKAPVILSSGFTELDAAKRFSGEGPTLFIQKPYRAQTLIEKVRVVVQS